MHAARFQRKRKRLVALKMRANRLRKRARDRETGLTHERESEKAAREYHLAHRQLRKNDDGTNRN